MYSFRLVSIFILAALFIGTLAGLTLGCDEEKNSNSSLLLLQGLNSNRTKRIFHYTGPLTGNLGGIAGADAICQTAAGANSYTGIWKAMLGAATRSITSDWVLRPNKTYVRASDEIVIGTTNGDAVFDFPLTNPMSTTTSMIWTGLYVDWTNDTIAGNCNNWTSGASGVFGSYGMADATDPGLLKDSGTACNYGPAYIICIEQ